MNEDFARAEFFVGIENSWQLAKLEKLECTNTWQFRSIGPSTTNSCNQQKLRSIVDGRTEMRISV